MPHFRLVNQRDHRPLSSLVLRMGPCIHFWSPLHGRRLALSTVCIAENAYGMVEITGACLAVRFHHDCC